jgi:hypothetical protein
MRLKALKEVSLALIVRLKAERKSAMFTWL